MDAKIERLPHYPNRFADEEYRGYSISYLHSSGTFYVSGPQNYRRGISSLRKDAKRWIDLLIEGKIK
jgi:hypothetical protein